MDTTTWATTNTSSRGGPGENTGARPVRYDCNQQIPAVKKYKESESFIQGRKNATFGHVSRGSFTFVMSFFFCLFGAPLFFGGRATSSSRNPPQVVFGIVWFLRSFWSKDEAKTKRPWRSSPPPSFFFGFVLFLLSFWSKKNQRDQRSVFLAQQNNGENKNIPKKKKNNKSGSGDRERIAWQVDMRVL